MKFVFISNYFNHHQQPFSDAMYQILGDEYVFIETEPMEEERKRLGWGVKDYPPYVVRSKERERNYRQYIKMISDADVVLIGSAPEKLIKQRKKKGRLVLRYSERPLKNGNSILKYPLRMIKWHSKNPRNKPIYMLCASAYTAVDYAKFGLFKNRCYKWGYFPECKAYESVENVILNKKKDSLLWVARLIDWKHPEMPIEVAKRLKHEGYLFQLNIIGNGILEDLLIRQIKEEELEDCVSMLGSMKPEEVRRHMEHSEIFLFTSDRKEGWGAVLNEAMNSACAVVASHAIGSVPYLVDNETNGLVYEDGDIDSLYKKVKWLLDNPEQRRRLATDAYKTICNMWNPKHAAKQLISLSEYLLNKSENYRVPENGPCSIAENIKDNWVEENW